MLCPKCGNSFFSMSVDEDSSCLNCGYFPTTISADVAAEVEENLNRKTFKGHFIQLPSLPKYMPAYALPKDDVAYDKMDRKPGRPPSHHKADYWATEHNDGILRLRKRDAQ